MLKTSFLLRSFFLKVIILPVFKISEEADNILKGRFKTVSVSSAFLLLQLQYVYKSRCFRASFELVNNKYCISL